MVLNPENMAEAIFRDQYGILITFVNSAHFGDFVNQGTTCDNKDYHEGQDQLAADFEIIKPGHCSYSSIYC